MKMIALFLVLFITGLNAQAENGSYALQVGAYKQLDMALLSTLEQYGTLYTEETDQGLTRVKLGNYASRAEAEDTLKMIRNMGFQDAFLSSASGGVSNFEADAPIVEMASSYSSNGYVNPESLPIWNQLSDDQRENVIYLDGILHIEEDGQFIRLSDYARKVMQ